MSSEVLKVEERKDSGSLSSRKIRREAQIPAVLYGMGEKNQHLIVPRREIETALRHHTRVFELGLGSKKVHALLKHVQYDHLGDDVLHLDFYRVKAGQKVRVEVTLVFDGHPKGVSAGGEFVHVISELEVDCDVDHIPESIEVKVGDLELNQSIHVKDLALPPGVTTPAGPEEIVCSVVTKVAAEEPEAEAPAEGEGVQPELIRKPPSEEGDEGSEGEKPKD